jgi:hypothetical protein
MIPNGFDVAGLKMLNGATIPYNSSVSSWLTSNYPPDSGYKWWGGEIVSGPGPGTAVFMVTLQAQDTNYDSGSCGLVSYWRSTTPTDATFDNYLATVTDPNADIAPAIRHPVPGTPQVVTRLPVSRFTNFHPPASGLSFTANTFSTNLIAAAATKLHAGFVPVRKKGKLPFKTIEQDYALEYGTATVAMHVDALKPGARVVLIDDLLATGGTVKANIALIEKLGGKVVGIGFLIELDYLEGRKALDDKYEVFSLIKYENTKG